MRSFTSHLRLVNVKRKRHNAKRKREHDFARVEQVDGEVFGTNFPLLRGWEIVHFTDRRTSRRKFSMVANLQPLELDRIEGFSCFEDFALSMRLPVPHLRIIYGLEEGTGPGLIYPPFRTLQEYVDGSPDPFTLPEFPKILKGVIKDILRMQKAGVGCQINPSGIVVFGTDKGHVMPILPLSSRTNEDSCLPDFMRLKATLEILGEIPQNVESLLECMPLAQTEAMRWRLLESPYFLSEGKELWDFVRKISLSLISSEGYDLALKKKDVLGWQDKVRRLTNAEMRAIYEHGPYKSDSYADLLRFIRNVYMHAHQRRDSLIVLQEMRSNLLQTNPGGSLDFKYCVAQTGTTSVKDMVRSLDWTDIRHFKRVLRNVVNAGMRVDPNEAPIMDTNVVFDFIRDLFPSFFDVVFLASYKLRGNPIIPILDASFLGGQ